MPSPTSFAPASLLAAALLVLALAPLQADAHIALWHPSASLLPSRSLAPRSRARRALACLLSALPASLADPPDSSSPNLARDRHVRLQRDGDRPACQLQHQRGRRACPPPGAVICASWLALTHCALHSLAPIVCLPRLPKRLLPPPAVLPSSRTPCARPTSSRRTSGSTASRTSRRSRAT